MANLTYEQRIEALNSEFNLTPEEAAALTSAPKTTTDPAEVDENESTVEPTKPAIVPAPIQATPAPPAPEANAGTRAAKETQALAEASQTAQQAVVEIHTKKAADIAYEASINSTETANKYAEEVSQLMQDAGMDPTSASSVVFNSHKELVKAIGQATEARRLERNFNRDLGSFKNNFGANLISTLNGGESPYVQGIRDADGRVAQAASAIQDLSESEQLLLTSLEKASTLDDRAISFDLNAKAASQFIVDRGREIDVNNADVFNKSTVDAYLKITGKARGDSTDLELQQDAEAYFKELDANRATSQEARSQAQESRLALDESQRQEERQRTQEAVIIDIQQRYPEATKNLTNDQALVLSSVIARQEQRRSELSKLTTEERRAETAQLTAEIAKLEADERNMIRGIELDQYIQTNQLSPDPTQRPVNRYLMAKDRVIAASLKRKNKEQLETLQDKATTGELKKHNRAEEAIKEGDNVLKRLQGNDDATLLPYTDGSQTDELNMTAVLTGFRTFDETVEGLNSIKGTMTPANQRVFASAISVKGTPTPHKTITAPLAANSSPSSFNMMNTGLDVVSADPAFNDWVGKLTEAPSLADLGSQVNTFYSADRTRQVEAIVDWYTNAYNNYADSPVTEALHLPIPSRVEMGYVNPRATGAAIATGLVSPLNFLGFLEDEFIPLGDPRDPGYINAYLATTYGATK